MSSTVVQLPRALALADLARSGLDERDYKRLKVEALSSDQTFELTQKFRARALRLPYLGPDGRDTGFYRLRFLDDVRGFGARKPQKYWQPPDSEARAYFAPYLDWAQFLSDHAKELWITEGEKKAAAACRADLPTIGLGGVWSWRSTRHRQPLIPDLATIAWPGRRVVLAFDTEADANPLVTGALEALGHTLEQRGATVGVLSLPLLEGEDKTGLDDFLVARGPSALKKLEAQTLASGTELVKLNDELVVIEQPSGVLYLKTGALYASARPLIDLHYAHRRVSGVDSAGRLVELNAVSEWLRWPHHRVAPGLAFEPGEPPLLADGRRNLWTGWPGEAKRGDVSLFIKLIDYLFSAVEPSYKTWFLQWLAYPVQRPGAKLYTAVIFWGRETGTGKSLVGYTMRSVYGLAWALVTEAELHGSFNSWQAKKQFILGEEITGSDRRLEANRLKHLITGEVARVNAKYQPEYDIRNCANFFFTSNQPDAFMLEDRDRRYFVHCVDDALGQKPPERWFTRTYNEWVKEDPTAGPALRHYLSSVDLTDFDPLGRAPETAARADMISVSGGDADRLARQLREAPDSLLRLGDAPMTRDLYTIDELVRLFDPEGRRRLSDQVVARALRRAGFAPPEMTRTSRGRLRLWAVRHQEKWARADHARRQAHYDGAPEAGKRPVKF